MKKFFKRAGITIGIALLLLLAWGIIEPYTIAVEQETAEIPNLPQAWEGKDIAVLGDFQVGMWMDNDSVIPRAVDKIIEEEPQAVLLLGDYVYHPADDNTVQMEKVADALTPLEEADIPVFALLGNHDYAMDKKDDRVNQETADRVDRMLGEKGIRVLQNESVPLTLKNNEVTTNGENENTLYLGGLGASWPGNVDVPKALRNIPDNAPRLFMMHNPEAFKKLPPDSAPAAVAGHTHGGQIRIPFTPEWSYKDLGSKNAHVDGWTDESYGRNGNSLYVNRGIGFSLFPIRINCPPEITFFKLSAKA
ncbi:metallophosphoesterase [Rossellomorea vietnamensis]|uniref:Metallophosphoesterase n=1 Tax=Rossellomorea vietnamensis TaxID=218284 RepID=A0A5D4NS22_9BACI|nr:metallophosphoesterase [Rossellomorea vietnamensis]TYS17155.1 metallophosphoesterase [Rossellomorea vietnamensis]